MRYNSNVIETATLASLIGARSGVRMIRRPFEPHDEISFADNKPSAEDAPLVEGNEFVTIALEPTASEFTHFCDGSQKSRLAFYDGEFPGYLAMVNAAILRREDREMLDQNPAYRDAFSVYGVEGSGALDSVSRAYSVRKVICDRNEGMSGFVQSLKDDISQHRESLELELVVDWMDKQSSGWLLVDGSIYKSSALRPGFHSVVGVVKSHSKQYFADPDKTKLVLGLKAGERSSVFEIGTKKYGHAYSWYLRLREDENESPAFGLIRVEMPSVDESVKFASEVSSWILDERSPYSLPDPRFDRLLYPIRRVEMYLKSKQPSDAALSGRVGA